MHHQNNNLNRAKEIPLQKRNLLNVCKNYFITEIDRNIPAMSLELFEDKKLTVRGATGIIEYTNETVRINSMRHVITVCGCNLTISVYTQTSIVLHGVITDIKLS